VVSEGGEGRTEIVLFWGGSKKQQEMNIHGSEFQVVGAEIRKAREPSERLRRWTVSSLAEEKRTVRSR